MIRPILDYNSFAFPFFFFNFFKSTWRLISKVFCSFKLLNMIWNPYKLASLIILNCPLYLMSTLFRNKFDHRVKLFIINVLHDLIKGNPCSVMSYIVIISKKIINWIFQTILFFKKVFCYLKKYRLLCWSFLILLITLMIERSKILSIL